MWRNISFWVAVCVFGVNLVHLCLRLGDMIHKGDAILIVDVATQTAILAGCAWWVARTR